MLPLVIILGRMKISASEFINVAITHIHFRNFKMPLFCFTNPVERENKKG